MLQDVRWSGPAASRLQRLSYTMLTELGLASRWWHQASPEENAEGMECKVMGGAVLGMWGDWSGSAEEIPYSTIPHGRWVGVRVKGPGDRVCRLFSCYRPPRSPAAGSLHSRLAKAMEIAPKDVHDTFYSDLLKEIQPGPNSDVIILGGDFNADPAATSTVGRKLSSFCESGFLTPLGMPRVRAPAPTATYVNSGAHDSVISTAIDHILLSNVLNQHCASRKVQRIHGRTLGHRAVGGTLGPQGTGLFGFTDGGLSNRREWARAVRAQSRDLWRRPGIISAGLGETFRTELPAVPAETWEAVTRLETLASWGGDAWRDREALIPPTTQPADLDSDHSQQAWVGRTYDAMLMHAAQLATSAEESVLAALSAAARRAHPRKGRPMSRRACGGWYPGVEQDRKLVGWLDRAVGNAAMGRWGRARTWAQRAGIDTTGSRRQWADLSKTALEQAKQRKQGRRRAAWATAHHGRWDRLRQAAIKGDAGMMARAFRGKRANGILREVEVVPGTWARGAKAVQAAATNYFDEAFRGRPATEAPLQALLADTPAGRQLRTDAADGRFPPEWKTALGTASFARLSTMTRRKTVHGQELAPGWHSDWLRDIDEEEWFDHWASRRRTSAPGPSGVGVDVWKEAHDEYHLLARRLYSACMGLRIQPAGWKSEIIIPIPKRTGALALSQLRPLKLLEVTKKAVLAIVKRRMAEEMEAAGVLDDVQCGFRPGFSCHTAAARMQTLFESARRHNRELHVVLLDIEKAYDSVDRSWGKGVALSRLGVDDATIEWLTESDRNTHATVRTGWEPYLREKGRRIPNCYPRCGFTQGGPESPFLWNCFYDMIAAQLRTEGVGDEIYTLNTPGTGESQGLGIFADDTAVWSHSADSMTRQLSAIRGILDLVGMRVAGHKSEHMRIRFSRGKKELHFVMMEEAEDDYVYMGDTRIPAVEFDVGLRYLGFWIDAASDYGEQTHILELRISAFTQALAKTRLPPTVALYLYRSVLTPQVLYPLALATLTFAQIDALENLAWRNVAGKLGCYPNMATALRHMPVEQGGLGLTPWWWMVLRTRIDLLQQWSSHKAGWVRAMYNELAAGWAQDSAGCGQGTFGTRLRDSADKAWRQHRLHTWLGSTHSLITGAGGSFSTPSMVRQPSTGRPVTRLTRRSAVG